MIRTYTRRDALNLTGRFVAAGVVAPKVSFGADHPKVVGRQGLVAGQMTAAEVGNNVLREGGNAIDAIVAAALAACVASPQNCGIGGYGGHMILALKGGSKITAIDFNSAAPAAAQPNMFPLGPGGAVRGRINEHGWLATGVPGTLAGLQFALDRYGTRTLRELVSPAIHLADDGFVIIDGLARAIQNAVGDLRKDSASANLFLRNGAPLPAGDKLRNPDLAKMLGRLARENSVEPFYRGEIARQIAVEFERHGGLVTAKDLSAYQPREVEPLSLEWRGFTMCTAPLTAGGLTVLQALSILKALGWDKWPAGAARSHGLVEALRMSWQDRLQLLGDPAQVKAPVERLLSAEYAQGLATRIEAAVKIGKALPGTAESRPHGGTVHLNSADHEGNMVALTLTHGDHFGACVTVNGLGLLLGQGMSRFDPRPNHPNSPGPGKRPLHNMCPTILLRGGKPIMALGGTGGRMIPNALFNLLARFVGVGGSIEEAVAEPRVHTDGNLGLTMERKWPESETQYLREAGFDVKLGNNANVHALSINPQTGVCRALAR